MNLPLEELPMSQPRPRRLRRFGRWLLNRALHTFQYDTLFWRRSLLGLWGAYAAALIVTAFGMTTGFGTMADMLIALFLGILAMTLASAASAFVLTLAYVPLPRLFVSGFIYTGAAIAFILYHADMGMFVSLMCGVIASAAGMAAGLLFATMASESFTWRVKAITLGSVIVLTAALIAWQQEGFRPDLAGNADRADSAADSADADGATADSAWVDSSAPLPLALDNPATPGDYRVKTFTYGSGTDRNRAEYRSGADLITETVDASGYIKKWPGIREWFWGFDQTSLPVNGRVWMPEGEGRFPLVLIVHGNHLAEQFSDGGYAYLGELLASRGFITISVDENFLNYSVWGGIPNQDFKVRAWMLLKHLQQIGAFSKQIGNPFAGHVDLGQVVLMGHSRGGQAAPMAADWTRWFKDDKTLADLGEYRIQSVVAIAPTDKAIDKSSAVLKDVNYLTIQGALDGDVNDFYGDRQYGRVSFSNTAAAGFRFKSSIYIGEANHSRFNTDWGAMDDSLPGGLFLDRSGMMEADDQREIAKVYISAFLEATIHGKDEYRPLFQDYRYGSAWLPQSTYFNRYESSSFVPAGTFDEDRDKTKLLRQNSAEAQGLRWTEEEAKDRQRHNRGTRGVVLEWDEGRGGSYTVTFSDDFRRQLAASRSLDSFVFSFTNLERDLRQEDETVIVPLPDIEVELTHRGGAGVTRPLSAFMPVLQPVRSTFTIASWMEERIKDEKYKEETEPVFQSYRLPLSSFEVNSVSYAASELASVTFRFQGGPGKVMLDDIGFDAQ
ncbi:alpha/beta hydrolase [Paenibacillus methanolicus]|uniref:Chlorophyllase-like protein n=1 Tax=Paenibacillus methanolicus TaxID=582686 RepID=A0A5S5C3E3_9BACL|nr:alpha/beta hydrolase [Paenibacillus methanolicus]TYP73941.1 chlorophyllase-like protein [Paenibacillus methanolicus]